MPRPGAALTRHPPSLGDCATLSPLLALGRRGVDLWTAVMSSLLCRVSRDETASPFLSLLLFCIHVSIKEETNKEHH